MNRNRHQSKGRGSTNSCICPSCGEKIQHKIGKPCRKEQCPKCGSRMVKEDSYYYQVIKDE